ncbi:MAG: type II toxin-antitoxin system PemK/MazF family toxin, partial [Thermosynechococcaceae cyanobacterium]
MVIIQGETPRRGDILKLQFNPQAGREQAGYRPVIVISPVE